MVKLIKWIGVSKSFKRLKHFVSPYETDLGTIEMKNEE